ncbi:MAG TPA: TIM-barrel domain-containing protein [Kofleriaceae bacterium]|nr:TIM-barrel domain-containing protein [Kofleriaceae bacterium]
MNAGRLAVAALALAGSCRISDPVPERPPQRFAFDKDGRRLVIEVLADDLVHAELGPASGSFDPARPIFTSPMVVGHPAPIRLTRRGNTIETDVLTVAVDGALCASIARSGRTVARVCPAAGGMTIDPHPGSAGPVNAYGLGQACIEPGLTAPDWSGRVRQPGNEHGNRMETFDGGACGNTQIPVVYGLDSRAEPFALFVDEPRAQTWDLARRPWRVTSSAPALRWYFLAAATLPELRADYLELTGKPPVPPRAAFGLWVSEYGYEDWQEVDGIVAGLDKHGFPLSGIILDLQWFGGIRPGREDTSMGRLDWDTARFPDPAGKIAALRDRGIGVIPIEESYVGRALPEHARLARDGTLVRTRSGQPVYLDRQPWWGKGGMIDWSSTRGADAWHDWKRRPLVLLGVTGHWTDLGEPEQFDPAGVYHGFPGVGRDQAAVHNLYNLAWAESIVRGYRRHREVRRPFILTRSGTAGIQRTGAAMWSGDLGSRFTSLAAQQRNRVNMVMSGVDYYGSDVGGFNRDALGSTDVDDLYTRWLASASLSEVPVRPHTENLKEKHETSPDRIGHRASNLAAIQLRYRLIPYLYSLAHRAHDEGEPVFPPLFFHYPEDREARAIGDQTLIGRDLLAAMAIEPGRKSRRVYLPAGTWYDYRDGTRTDSAGQWVEAPLERGGVLALPLYARAGAVIPIARGSALAARIFPGEGAFELVEDDGATIDYLAGAVRRTTIRRRRDWIEIEPAGGSYRGAPGERAIWLEVVGAAPRQVLVGRGKLLRHDSLAALEKAGEGWTLDGGALIVALRATPVTERRRILLAE